MSTKNASPIAKKFEESRTTTKIEKTRRKIPEPMLRVLLCIAFGSIDKSNWRSFLSSLLKQCRYWSSFHGVTMPQAKLS